MGVSLKLANNLRNFLAVLVILPIVFLAFGTGLLRGHFIDLKRARRSLRERAQGRLFKTLLSWGLLAGIAVAAGWYVKTHWKEFRSLPSVPLWGWGAVVAGILLMHVWKGLTFDLMTRSLGVRLRGKERLGLSFLTSFGNLFGAARAGVLMRSVYLKRRGLPYSLFVSTLAGGYILSILALMLTGGAGLTWLYATGVRVSLGLALLVSGLVVATGALLIWAPTPPKWQKGIFGSIARALEGWRKILSHKQLVWKTLGTCLLIVLNLIAVLWIIYRLLGSHVPLGALAVMSSLGGIATLIAITPGAIGFFDAAVIVSGSYLGVAPEVGLAAMLVYRTTDAGLTLTLGGLSAWLLFRGKESMEDNSPR